MIYYFFNESLFSFVVHVGHVMPYWDNNNPSSIDVRRFPNVHLYRDDYYYVTKGTFVSWTLGESYVESFAKLYVTTYRI